MAAGWESSPLAASTPAAQTAGGWESSPLASQPAPVQQAPAPAERSLFNKVERGVGNIIPSGERFLTGLGEAIANPIDTTKAIGNILQGEALLQSGLDYKEQPEKLAQLEQAKAVNSFYKERYGSWGKFTEALQTDPVGVLADVSTVLLPVTGGLRAGSGLAGIASMPKTASALGAAANVASEAGRLTNPLTPVLALQGLPGIKQTLGAIKTIGGDVIQAATPGAENTQFKRASRQAAGNNPETLAEINRRLKAGESLQSIAVTLGLPSLAAAVEDFPKLDVQTGTQASAAKEAQRSQVGADIQRASNTVKQAQDADTAASAAAANLAESNLASAQAPVVAPPTPFALNALAYDAGMRQAAGANQLAAGVEAAGLGPSAAGIQNRGVALQESIQKQKAATTAAEVDPHYEEARILSGNKLIDPTPVLEEIARSLGTTVAKLDPGAVPQVLRKFLRTFQQETDQAILPVGMSMSDAIDAHTAINRSGRTISALDPARSDKLSALSEAKKTLLAQMQTNFDPAAMKAFETGTKAFKTEIGDVYLPTDLTKKLVFGKMPPSEIFDNFFKSSSDSGIAEIKSMADMVKGNPAARKNLASLIEDFYARKVLKGKMTNEQFLKNYNESLTILDAAGVNLDTVTRFLPKLSGNVEKVQGAIAQADKASLAAATKARSDLIATREAEKAAGKTSAKASAEPLKDLESRIASAKTSVGGRGGESVSDILSSVPEAESVLAEVEKFLQQDKRFKELAAEGRGFKTPSIDGTSILTGIQLSDRVTNYLLKAFVGDNAVLKLRIAKALLTKESAQKAFKSAARPSGQEVISKTASLAKNALIKSAPALSNAGNVNQLGR